MEPRQKHISFLSGLLLVAGLVKIEAAPGPAKPNSEFYEIGHGSSYYSHDDYLSDWNADSWGRLHQPKCVDIPSNMSLCKDIGYNKMRLPNLLDHDSMAEVTQQARPWVPLHGLGCHPNTKLFLCSLFSPVCLDRPIWPCRTLCEGVKAGCEGKMLQYGFPWPDMLNCEKFPPDNDLCIGLQSETNSGKDDSVCEACDHPQTFEAIVDSFCTSDFVVRVRIQDQVVVGSEMKITAAKKKKKFKDNGISKKDYRNMVLYMENAARCDCQQLTNAGRKDNMIMMGKIKSKKLVVTHMVKYDKHCKDTRRAMKAIQKEDICKGGLKAIADTEKMIGEEEKAGKAKLRKNKKDRNRRKRNRKNANDAVSTSDNNRSKKDRRKGSNNRKDREREGN